MKRRDFIKASAGALVATSFTAELIKKAWEELSKEQRRVYDEFPKGPPTQETRPFNIDVIPAVYVMNAVRKSEGGIVGLMSIMFDSPKSRELMKEAGLLVCDGSEYDPEIYPELKFVLNDCYGKNKLPDLRSRISRS